MVGADFDSLEDKISALTTKDPNKLIIYEQGYDSHSYRAYYYFRNQMPDITLTEDVKHNLEQIKIIKEKYKHLRQLSKAPTFALTYSGTHHTLMSNCGFSKEDALAIEKGYHSLYQVSDAYTENQLRKCCEVGYVEVAFGLKVRAPLLKQCDYDQMPPIAKAEARTIGNALGQSYCLLNSRALNAFMEVVWKHPKMATKILPIAAIHDALYFMVEDDLEVVLFLNQELVKAMSWQELPEIKHATVKLSASLELFYPSWAYPISVPNDCDATTLISIANKVKEDLNAK